MFTFGYFGLNVQKYLKLSWFEAL